MKKILLSALVAFPLMASAQMTLFTENFDSYNNGDYAGVVSPYMSTWSGATGGSEDCLVTNADASSPSNSIVITGAQGGGSIDAMVVFPDNYTSGRYEFSMKYKVAANKGGYFNLQSNGDTPGTAWLAEVYFASDGTGSAQLGGQALTFNYTNNAWIDILCDLDMDNDLGHIYIGGVEVGTGFAISVEAGGAGTGANMKWGGVNLYSAAAPAPAVGDCEYYVDDMELVMTGGLGIGEGELNPAIAISPNPTSGNFSVNFEDMSMDNATVTLVDVLGKVIYNERMSVVGNGSIPFSMNLRNGVYFVSVSNGSSKLTKKIIVRK